VAIRDGDGSTFPQAGHSRPWEVFLLDTLVTLDDAGSGTASPVSAMLASIDIAGDESS